MKKKEKTIQNPHWTKFREKSDWRITQDLEPQKK